MFEIGWSEMAVIALIALIVIGPKELPNAMRAAAKWARKARSLAREFQSGIDDMVREAELDDARKAFDATRNMDVGKTIEGTIDPTGEVRDEAGELERTARRPEDQGEGAHKIEAPQRAPDAEVEPKTGAAGEAATTPDRPGATEDGTEGGTGEGTERDAEAEPRARVIRQPFQMAPPDSVTPPRAEEEPLVAEEAAESEEAPQRARTS